MAPTLPQSCLLRAPSLTSSLSLLSISRPFSQSVSQKYKQDTPRQNPPFSPSGPGARLPPIPSPTSRSPHIPSYPFGPRQVYHQSNSGLYGSASIRFGNTVSERNEIKTRRSWRPNVQQKRLWSASLNCFVRTRLTTRVLRTIDKVGGLDEYLLGVKTQRLKDLGPWGWRLRWRIMQTDAIKERMQQESKDLGLPLVDRQWRKAGLHLLPDGKTTDAKTHKAMMEETDRIIKSDKEMPLEEEGKLTTADEGFMKEETQQKQKKVKA
ncbi:ribosomal L28 family-domain-containing protein [Podospora australis]|uniref:Large ribosomal subunit protein bL28m n=1 Tax=Podospora australis TaxID=1536484 RepID=A0AAN7AFC1_9PEZI|nr:ribosomal L28 family-domain-containing protein [Podospora australis]